MDRSKAAVLQWILFLIIILVDKKILNKKQDSLFSKSCLCKINFLNFKRPLKPGIYPDYFRKGLVTGD